MKLVVDANVIISALIADAKSRELIGTLEADLITPKFVTEEIENYEELVAEKSGMRPERVTQFIELLFQYIEVIAASQFYSRITDANDAISEVDPDDVLYLACALETDADIWSDDTDFAEQDLVVTHTTSDIIDLFDSN